MSKKDEYRNRRLRAAERDENRILGIRDDNGWEDNKNNDKKHRISSNTADYRQSNPESSSAKIQVMTEDEIRNLLKKKSQKINGRNPKTITNQLEATRKAEEILATEEKHGDDYAELQDLPSREPITKDRISTDKGGKRKQPYDKGQKDAFSQKEINEFKQSMGKRHHEYWQEIEDEIEALKQIEEAEQEIKSKDNQAAA